MTLLNPIPIQPIGYVENNLGRRHYDEWQETMSTIIISEEYQDALYRIEEFSHIEILFYIHKITEKFQTRIYPTGNPEYPLIGAFATRTPNRPSKIGLTTCKLISVEDNKIKVKNLDALNGSPVLDIKPYTGKPIKGIKQPEWLKDIEIKKIK